MGTIEIITGPHELTIDGTTILMQADPSAGKAWGRLLDVEQTWGDEKQRKAMHDGLLESLAEMAETPDDAEKLRGLDLGTVTLQTISRRYVEAVTGFPTKPS